MSNKFGDRIRSLREGRKETQEEVSRATGIDRAMLSQYEGGKKDLGWMPTHTLLALAGHFGAEFADLLQLLDDDIRAGKEAA